MPGSTITTSIDHSITLGSAGYLSPLSITTMGAIDGSAAGAALYIPISATKSAVHNAGAILGGTGGASGTIGLPGADGIYLSGAANLINVGEIAGGAGGTGASGSNLRYGAGGIGIDINAAGVTVRNDASIVGGAGSDGFGQGGIGVELAAGSKLNNSGTIMGGAGGESGGGVSDSSGRLINTGSISGGMGGFYGGFGVYITGAGAFGSNTGDISGGSARAFSNYTYGYGLHATNGAVFHNGGTIAGGRQSAGVVLSDATMINTGAIQGGYNSGLPSGLQGYYLPDTSGVIFDSGRLVNKGTIIGGNAGYRELYGGYGGNGVEARASFTNFGLITGGVGGSYYGGYGGIGVTSSQAVLNDGTIKGGKGGKGAATDGAGNGGKGLTGAGAVVNHGVISGGNGGGGGDYGGQGGGGVYMSSGTLTNTGKINGGKGNAHELRDYLRPNGGIGGIGVSMGTGTIDNTGKIFGGDGSGGGSFAGAVGGAGVVATNNDLINLGDITGGKGGGGSAGAKGGDGVDLNGGTLINGGTITGGAGGIGADSTGTAGDAVSLGSHSILIIEPKAAFNGLVEAMPGGGDTLEVSGHSAAALTGIGEEFTGFATFAFALGAAWTLSGTTQGLATGEAITGFTTKDAIGLTNAAASSGTVTVATAGTVTIDAGGTDYALDIAGATVGETDFRFADYLLTKSAAAMSFQSPSPEPAMAGAPALGALFAPPTRFDGGVAAAGGLTATFAAPSLVGAIDDPFRDRQNVILPAMTLHA